MCMNFSKLYRGCTHILITLFLWSQEEGSNEPEDGKEVIGSKESKTEKKETESGEEEGEEPEEGEEKQDGEGPEEGEKSTDGELDDVSFTKYLMSFLTKLV